MGGKEEQQTVPENRVNNKMEDMKFKSYFGKNKTIKKTIRRIHLNITK